MPGRRPLVPWHPSGAIGRPHHHHPHPRAHPPRNQPPPHTHIKAHTREHALPNSYTHTGMGRGAFSVSSGCACRACCSARFVDTQTRKQVCVARGCTASTDLLQPCDWLSSCCYYFCCCCSCCGCWLVAGHHTPHEDVGQTKIEGRATTAALCRSRGVEFPRGPLQLHNECGFVWQHTGVQFVGQLWRGDAASRGLVPRRARHDL